MGETRNLVSPLRREQMENSKITIYWMYIDSTTSKTKHAFLVLPGVKAYCGTGDDKFKWRNDEKGLKKRRRCAKCVYSLKTLIPGLLLFSS